MNQCGVIHSKRRREEGNGRSKERVEISFEFARSLGCARDDREEYRILRVRSGLKAGSGQASNSP